MPLAISPNSEIELDSDPYDMLTDEMKVKVEGLTFEVEKLRKDTSFTQLHVLN